MCLVYSKARIGEKYKGRSNSTGRNKQHIVFAACPRFRYKLVQECAKRSHNKNFYRSTGDIQKSQTNN